MHRLWIISFIVNIPISSNILLQWKHSKTFLWAFWNSLLLLAIFTLLLWNSIQEIRAPFLSLRTYWSNFPPFLHFFPPFPSLRWSAFYSWAWDQFLDSRCSWDLTLPTTSPTHLLFILKFTASFFNCSNIHTDIYYWIYKYNLSVCIMLHICLWT